jgi:hypothetical protein
MFSLICGVLTQKKCSNIIAHGSHTKGRIYTQEKYGKERKPKTGMWLMCSLLRSE